MIAYLLRVILCSGLLLLIYHLLLEKETIHRFKRAYLLFAVLFSFIAPLITITLPASSPLVPQQQNFIVDSFYVVQHSYTPIAVEEQSSLLWLIPIAIYTFIALILLIRFIRNIYILLIRAARHPSLRYEGAKIILLNEIVPTHTFFNIIFLNKDAYARQKIEAEVLTHELTHVRQKHTLDIIFIELITAIAWFNPVFFLYKKAIRINHEFLADEKVISLHKNIHAYQQLLLQQVARVNHYHLTSSLNFLLTKKRLIMMTRNKNHRRELFKKLMTAPLFVVLIALFSTKIYSQETPPRIIPDTTRDQVQGLNQDGISEEAFKEYERLANDTTTVVVRKGVIDEVVKYRRVDISKLNKLYNAMSKEQKAKATRIPGLVPLAPPPARRSPSAAQLHSWEDSKMYGVWIDGKRVPNSSLSQYKPSDFDLFFVSRLMKNAINYGKHYVQVDLMTPSYYNNAYLTGRE